MAEYTAHSTELYSIGKGIIKFDRFDSDGLPTGLRDLGNCPSFVLIPSEDVIEHYSSREGIDTLDWQRGLRRKLTGRFTLDEYDRENLRLALFGETGTYAIYPLTAGAILGELDFTGTNDVGPRWHVQLWKVMLRATSEVNFISSDLATISFEFSVQNDEENHPNDPYGRITLIGES